MNFKSFKLWLNIVTIIGLAVLIFFSWDQILATFEQLGSLDFPWLACIIPLQILNFWSAGKFYQTYLKALGEQVRAKTMFSLALEMNFVNHVLPSGGVSGFGYSNYRLKGLGVPTSKGTLTQGARFVMTFLSFIVFLLFALILLAIFGNASRLMILISSTIIFLLVSGSALGVYIISDSKRIKSFMAFLPKLLNKVFGVFRKGKGPTINIEKIEKLFEDLHQDYVVMSKNWRALVAPFMWTMLMNLTELTTIFVVYLAFGSVVNPGAIIVAYAVANLAGLIAILPGGVGIYEGLMTAVMAAGGVPKALALSATLVYRILTMLLFLPPGFVLYQIALKDKPGLKQQLKDDSP